MNKETPKNLKDQFGFGNNYDMIDIVLPANNVYKRALELGWSNGCPRARYLSDPVNPDFGPIRMMRRYNETNQMFVWVSRTLQWDFQEKLHRELLKPYARVNSPGIFEPESVPEDYRNYISPMSGVFGYAIPRILIDGTGQSYRGAGACFSDYKSRHFVTETIRFGERATSINQFLSYIADQTLLNGQISPELILSHILSAELLAEQNCPEVFDRVLEELKDSSPDLYRTYVNSSRFDRDQFGIATL